VGGGHVVIIRPKCRRRPSETKTSESVPSTTPLSLYLWPQIPSTTQPEYCSGPLDVIQPDPDKAPMASSQLAMTVEQSGVPQIPVKGSPNVVKVRAITIKIRRVGPAPFVYIPPSINSKTKKPIPASGTKPFGWVVRFSKVGNS
jgi:hypothetical protein